MALCAQQMSQRHTIFLKYVEAHGLKCVQRLQSVTHSHKGALRKDGQSDTYGSARPLPPAVGLCPATPGRPGHKENDLCPAVGCT